MCGITGLFSTAGQPVDPAQLSLMTQLLRHRGPDDFGYAFFEPSGRNTWQGKDLQLANPKGSLALGHRRLSIIDPHPSSAQPMVDNTNRYWITYNGEIYNYIELRKQLQQLGHRFTTQGDTEVILKAYAQWGRDCVNHFNGMWAFAIWDSQKQILFCSRDRMGIKPFYYTQNQHRFIFASEIKSVLAALPTSQHQLNKPYLGRFILYGLLNDGQDTFFNSIHQLLPAHCLEIKQGQIKQWRYWDIPKQAIRTADRAESDPQEAVEHFRELLSDAIRLRFRADVPVGTNLSGGLDSSSIVALATQKLASSFSSFTVQYDEPEFAEGHFAQLVADTCKTNAHFITPNPDDYLDFIDRFTWFHDEPCAGSGMFSQWHVMELASQHVKVVLDGQGADELLGGYQHYYQPYLTSLLNRFEFKQFLQANRDIADHHQLSLSQWAYRFARNSLKPMFPDTFLSGGRMLRRLADPDILNQALPFYRPRPRKYRDDLNESLYWELTRDNLPMLLQNGDRISMAFSIESRYPFLDYRLIEYVSSLPYTHKIDGRQTKVLLRRAMQNHLPDKIVNRSDKMGFPTPFSHWLKGPLNDYVRDTFTSQTFRERELFNSKNVLSLLDQHCHGLADHSWLLWRILNIENFSKIFLDDFSTSCSRYTTNDNPNQCPKVRIKCS